MKIKMIGIDYSTAILSQREIFAFSTVQAQGAMRSVIDIYGVKGCVIVSTCNRTEIYICEDNNRQTDLATVLCGLKEVHLEEYKDLLTAREGIEAVRHLFKTACGLKSQIWGEDQILTQIRASIEAARNVQTANEVMEKLFQNAITSAKRIKSTVRLTSHDPSVATKALDITKTKFLSLSGLKCLVLGNGEMGKMISSMLAENGAHVTVTLRKYKNKTSPVPEGCIAVNYEHRLAEIEQAELIISATSSPHYTIKFEDVSTILADRKRRVFIDLAVPRDIDPRIVEYDNLVLLDIESLGGLKRTESSNRSLLIAKQIIDKYIDKFIKWNKVRESLSLKNNTVSDISESIKKKNLQANEYSLKVEYNDQKWGVL